MKLPNANHAVIEIEKLRNYCLSAIHPRGRHKARVFMSALGMSADDSEELRKAILSAILSADATPTEQDEYGQRYIVDFTMKRQGLQAEVRTAWIIRSGEEIPRLTSCYVLQEIEMKNQVKLLDVVALTEDLPNHNLQRGQVGTVVEVLAPNVFEVEFSDNDGRAFAEVAIPADKLLVLHYEPMMG